MKACLHTFFAIAAFFLAPEATAGTSTPTHTPTCTPSPSITLTHTMTQTRTISETFTVSPTITLSSTLTPTPGIGRYVVSPAGFSSGSSGNALSLQFFPETAFWPSSGGLLTLIFPAAFTAPVASNFYAMAMDQIYVSGISYSGQTATVTLHDLAPGESVTFRYGFDAAGFAVSTSITPQRFEVYSYPDSTVSGIGGQLEVQPAIQIFTPVSTKTVTPTKTATRTQTPDWTATSSSTQTPTSSVTPTWTESPIGPQEQGVYSYPNPFDIKKFEKCTFRFPSDPDAKVTVFNLVGEPVRELPSSDINGAQGWAIWPGLDDYLRRVPGGLYYVRIRGKETHVRKFTVLN